VTPTGHADPDTLRTILAGTRALLLDFDGPVCAVFSGVPAATVAGQLRTVLADCGPATLPEHVRRSADPFDVFRYAATLGTDEARYVEAAFRAHEVDAIRSAEPAPSAHDLIRAWHATGRPLAIVSNNSDDAVSAYLDLHNLRRYIAHVAARTTTDPAQLKPSPHLLTDALAALDTRPQAATLIGDSTSDIQAAHAAGTLGIGYANKPGKRARFATERPAAIIGSLAELVTQLPQR
jgi:HAD superfamily hydrolase (TIGR01509 family)